MFFHSLKVTVVQRLESLGRERQRCPVLLPGLPGSAALDYFRERGPRWEAPTFRWPRRGRPLPLRPPPPSTFCEAAGKRIWTLVLTSPRCLGPEGRGPQTQKETGLQHTGQRAHGRLTRKGEDWAVRALKQAEGTVQPSGWCCAEGTDAHAETVRASRPGSSPSVRLGKDSWRAWLHVKSAAAAPPRLPGSRSADRQHAGTCRARPAGSCTHPAPGHPTPGVAGGCHTESPEGRTPSTPSAH